MNHCYFSTKLQTDVRSLRAPLSSTLYSTCFRVYCENLTSSVDEKIVTTIIIIQKNKRRKRRRVMLTMTMFK